MNKQQKKKGKEKILKIIDNINRNKKKYTGQEGVFLDNIAKRMPDFSVKDINKLIEELIEEGAIKRI